MPRTASRQLRGRNPPAPSALGPRLRMHRGILSQASARSSGRARGLSGPQAVGCTCGRPRRGPPPTKGRALSVAVVLLPRRPPPLPEDVLRHVESRTIGQDVGPDRGLRLEVTLEEFSCGGRRAFVHGSCQVFDMGSRLGQEISPIPCPSCRLPRIPEEDGHRVTEAQSHCSGFSVSPALCRSSEVFLGFRSGT